MSRRGSHLVSVFARERDYGHSTTKKEDPLIFKMPSLKNKSVKWVIEEEFLAGGLINRINRMSHRRWKKKLQNHVSSISVARSLIKSSVFKRLGGFIFNRKLICPLKDLNFIIMGVINMFFSANILERYKFSFF